MTRLAKGPYKVTVVKSEACQNTTKPYDKNPPFYFISQMYKSGDRVLLRGNLTVVKTVNTLKIRAKGYIQDDGKWKIMNMANSVGCHGTIMRIIKFSFNVPSRDGECLPKGMFTYKDLDYNAIQQMWTKTFIYGRFLWRLEFLSNVGIIVCWEYVSDVEPV